MARTWNHIRAEAVSQDKLDEAEISQQKRRLLSEARAHRLAEIRNAYGLNQTDLAKRLDISQPRVSRIERRDLDTAQVATLRAYAKALGGELEIAATFGDERVPLE